MTSIEFSQVFLLGIIQGIAEFLPISSSGHLVLLQHLLGLNVTAADDAAAGLRLNVALHLGTLLSILVVYRDDIWQLRKNVSLCTAIVVATIPVTVVGLTLKDTLETTFDSPLVASCGLMVTGVVLLVSQRLERGSLTISRCAAPAALAIGVFQSLAIIPGISRSGSTIAGGLAIGLNRDDAAKFSFLIAIPAIGGAALLYIWDMWQDGGVRSQEMWFSMLIGTTTSFVVGCLALRWLLSFLARRRLHWFAAYCFTVGVISAVWQSLV